MRKLSESDKELAWVQPNARERRFELRSGDDLIAMLQWEKLLGTLATATTATSGWTYKRAGFLSPRITVRSTGSDADVAIFVPSMTGSGRVETGNKTFAWKNISFWSNSWAFVATDGQALITYRPRCGWDSIFRLEAAVNVSPDAFLLPELPLLLTLGWYVMILMADDAAAATAATTVI